MGKTKNLKIMTWNIKDGGALNFEYPEISNIKHILSVIEDECPDIIVIQEYMSKFYHEFVMGLKKLGYNHLSVCMDYPDRIKRKRVLIASKLYFSNIQAPNSIFKYSRRNWNEIIINDISLSLLGVHVPLAEIVINGKKINNRKEKKAFLDALTDRFIEYRGSDKPCVICGDLNLHSKAVYSEYLNIFSEYLEEATTNIATHGEHKFDYIYVNDAFLKLLNKNTYKPRDTPYSDHKYLYVELTIE